MTYPYSWWGCDAYPSLCPLSELVSIHSVSDDSDGTRSEPIELTALSESPPPALPFCTMVAVFIVLLLHGTEPLAVSIIRTGYMPPVGERVKRLKTVYFTTFSHPYRPHPSTGPWAASRRRSVSKTKVRPMMGPFRYCDSKRVEEKNPRYDHNIIFSIPYRMILLSNNTRYTNNY